MRLYLIVVLICTSLMISDVQHLPCACWPSVYLLWKNAYSGSLPISNWVVWSFLILNELFIYFRYQPLIRYILCKYLLPFSTLSFHLVGFLCSSPICLFLLFCSCSFVSTFMSSSVFHQSSENAYSFSSAVQSVTRNLYLSESFP